MLTDARPRQDFLASPAKMVRLLKEKLQAGNSTHADSSILYVLGATDAYTVAIVKVSIIWTDNTDFYVSFWCLDVCATSQLDTVTLRPAPSGTVTIRPMSCCGFATQLQLYD